MTQTGFSDDPNDAFGYRVLQVLREFVAKLYRRVPDKHASDIIHKDVTANSTELAQKPERFIEETLVRPLGDALAYDYRPQPTGFAGLGGRYPDFTILNLAPVVIGEIKQPNTYKEARKDTFDYLQMAEDRPLYGLSTDGWSWSLFTAETDSDPEYRRSYSLRSLVKNIALQQNHEKASGKSADELRRGCTEFASIFSISALSQL